MTRPLREWAEEIVRGYVLMAPLSGTDDEFRAEATNTIESILTRCVEEERAEHMCRCEHAAAEHYGEGCACMGDAPDDPTGTIYCACRQFKLKPILSAPRARSTDE